MCPISDRCDCFSDVGVPGISYIYVPLILAVLTFDFYHMKFVVLMKYRSRLQEESLLKVRIDDCVRFLWQHNISHSQ